MSWHVPGDTLARFATTPDALDEVTASSVEQHLIACADCRASVAAAADPAALSMSWSAIAAEIDQPRSWAAERVLTRLGMPADLARVVGATPGLRVAWLAAVVGVAVLAVVAARDAGSDAPFLVLAPLVPVAAVALAFVPVAEPAGEAGVATALHGPAVALRRAAAVLVPTVAVLLLAGLALPDVAGGSVLWALPSLALVGASLALSTYVRVTAALIATSATWIAVLATARIGAAGVGDARVTIADLAVFRPVGQLVCLAVAALALAVVAVRRERFATMEVTW